MVFITKQFVFLVLFQCLRVLEVLCQDNEENQPYKGKKIGKFNSYHHQVGGDVYAVDEYTLLLTNFQYDGNGVDTFFWAGSSNRPGPLGFIVPDSFGTTNVLDRYHNKDFTLVLPDNKKITDIKWFAVYDLGNQNAFGDIYIPDGFEPPSPQKGGTFVGKSKGVHSGTVSYLDAKTIQINDFSFDGTGYDTYFWVGVGPQPSSKGSKIPDEYGYLDQIRAYVNETITLELPGEMTIFKIDWISIYDIETKENYGSLFVPDYLNVPPSLIKVQPHKRNLPNCVQLHKDLQVSWEVFGPQITIELAGQVMEDEYMAFGISGSDTKTQMLGSDVTIAYIDGVRGFAADYNITALAPCLQVLGQYKGVCRDDLVGGQDNNQLHTAIRENGVNTITFRRILISSDPGDREYVTDRSSYFVWAIGRLDHNQEPAFHDIYPKGNIQMKLGTKDPIDACFAFTRSDFAAKAPWEKTEIFDRSIRTFVATIGPSGGKRGYQGMTGQSSNGLAWYINGYLAPELWLRRGLTYAFKVFGGNNPHSAEFYHPLIITVDSHGGFDRLSDAAQENIRVLAGVEFTRRGRPRPTTVGPLCLAKNPNGRDRRLDDDYTTFRKFNRTLEYSCEKGEPAILEITPNTSWPDIVYYNSFTHSNMGWKIHIVDQYTKGTGTSLQISSALIISCITLYSVLFHA